MQSVEKLLDRQYRLWAFRRESRTTRPPPRRPTVTVSGQHGTHRSELGRRVAARLGYALWDREILHELAKRAHSPEGRYLLLDEHPRRFVRDLVASFRPASGPDTYEYSHRLMRVIRSVARHGGAVLIGRGAQFVVHPRDAVRVRLVGTIESRVESLARESGLDAIRARREIEHVDDDQRRFVRELYDSNIDDPLAYDLVLNSTNLSLDAATDVVAATCEARFCNVRPELMPGGRLEPSLLL